MALCVLPGVEGKAEVHANTPSWADALREASAALRGFDLNRLLQQSIAKGTASSEVFHA
jgi:hypothetical protein